MTQDHFEVAYVLVLHGSHAVRYQASVDRLKQGLDQQLGQQIHYRLVYLECAETSLSQQIQDFAQDLALATATQTIRQIQVLPLFLLPGVHVMQDIPAQVELARAALQRAGLPMTLQIQPYLGSQALLHDRLIQCLPQCDPGISRIVVAHGTKRSGGNAGIEALAVQLQASTAYWFVPPSLPERVTELLDRGVRRFVIIPYVLLAGSLTDGIAQQIEQLQMQFPTVQFDYLPALDESGLLLELIVAFCQQSLRQISMS